MVPALTLLAEPPLPIRNLVMVLAEIEETTTRRPRDQHGNQRLDNMMRILG